ncbi:hypothetical protein F53441_658 [Fusarium austroafricanum]|uniref:Cytochrome P450 monooxygenase n=1 Tax=Fusarium austroafricanum TaxID=2364996 RepID=A0A8H4KU99_9HYPO|nr:hypothetical protein F53441_658 [Fusarium austroafricanum]
MMTLSGIQLDSPPVLGIVAFLGIATHLAVFRISEWDVAVHRIIASFGLIYAFIFCLLAYHPDLDHQDLRHAWYTASVVLAFFISGLYGSMVVYRFFFHPLRRFPGPIFAPLSSLYAVSMSMKKFHMFSEVQKLHNTYGDFVRLGIYVLAISMRDYEPRVEKYTRLLMSQLQQRCGKVVDITEWCNFYGFDVMGDLAFGKTFNMLNDGVRHYYMELTQMSTLWGTQIARSSWLYLLIKSIPILNYQIESFLKWLRKHVDQRTKNEPDLPDLFSWLLGAYREQSVHTKQDELNLLGDAHLIVVAGSDTTSTSITCALFELARHPDVYQKLRKEVDELLDQEDPHLHSALAKLKYLQAVIDETMRLYPAIPSGLQRITPPQGLQIDGTFVPGNMIVQTPPYTLNRGEWCSDWVKCFVRPNEFIPERWTTQPELVRDASAFAPFSIGRYSCAGKQLGLLEVRHVLSQIVSKFDIRFAPNQTSEAFHNGLADGFTLVCPKLEMIFETRSDR